MYMATIFSPSYLVPMAANKLLHAIIIVYTALAGGGV